MIYFLVCMFACSCCIVIRAFVPSRKGRICKSTPGGGARSQFRELSPFSRLKQRQAHWIPLMHKLPMLFQPQPSTYYFMHDMILRQVIMAIQPQPFAAINLYTPWCLCHKWFEKRCEFSKENVFQNGYDEGFTLITIERDDQGLPGLGEGLRWWLSWFRCEHEGLSLSPKDRFVITPYLYSYQVQPLETVWAVTQSDLVQSKP
jgi:hypothetical protein